MNKTKIQNTKSKEIQGNFDDALNSVISMFAKELTEVGLFEEAIIIKNQISEEKFILEFEKSLKIFS
ncbi:MAG: hypothetical protein PHV30_07295 [Candidatus Margulisbacteria bacterium]|nr:hypothetical protein [Candidatus Margulisiibacteriota bacterium]